MDESAAGEEVRSAVLVVTDVDVVMLFEVDVARDVEGKSRRRDTHMTKNDGDVSLWAGVLIIIERNERGSDGDFAISCRHRTARIRT